MKCLAIFLLAVAVASSISAQQQAGSKPADAGAPAMSNGPNLSQERLGRDDLLGISVYDAPELTRNVRIDAEGNIRLPMVRQRIRAAGSVPAELESAITAALVDENVLVNPIVTVSVVEYHSRPITVVGAVRSPTTFQAAGSVTLLEAIVRAGGLADNAGSEILVSHPPSMTGGTAIGLTERIPVHDVMDVSNPASTMALEGGENIRVLDAGRIFVVGNVKHPGPLQITDGSASTVLKAVTLSGGLDSFSSHKAYIYRAEADGRNSQIPIEINKIMTFKSPDVPLKSNDMLYVPSATGQRISAKALGMTLGIGLGIATILIYILR
jgi:polysaccharide export outer membrane protein